MNDLEITNKLLVEMVKNLKQTNKNLTKVFIITILSLSIIIISGVIGFFIYESQYETAEQTELSLEQEASGEEAEINNVLGNMYKDNATHNEGK